jgi:hypothetical protein
MYSEYNKVDNKLLEDYAQAGTVQSNWSSIYEVVRQLVRPTSQSFNGNVSKGSSTSDRIYDSTAVWAAEQLASGLHTYLMDPADRWFSLGLKGVPFNLLSHESALWLETVTDIMFSYMVDPRSRVHASAKEVYQDLASYGTGVFFTEWDVKGKMLKTRAYPLASCRIDESASGLVDKLFRDMYWSVRKIQQEFPEARLPASMLSESALASNTEYKVTHAVIPNEKHVTSQFVPARISKKYASVYFIEENSVELHRGGYDVFPYHVPRWTTMPGEIYGRGPAVTAAPDIQLLNLMNKELIMAAQLSNRPPLVLEDDSFMLPIAYQPGSLIFKTPGVESPLPLQSGGNFGITLELMNQKREQIAKAFHVDWLIRERKKERQSVHEITDDRQEMLRQLQSVLGRIEAEFPSPFIKNLHYYLDRARLLPDPPKEIQGRPLDIIYTNPAAKAKDTVKAQNIMQYMADLAAFAQHDPQIYDGVDMPALGQDLAVYRDVSRRVLLPPSEVAKRKARREQDMKQQSQMAQTQQLGDVAGAMKDVATAQEKGLVLGG